MQRGNLVVDIPASGNLILSHEEELAFETGGTVLEIPVEVGDSVEEGQVLARLDISEWEDELTQLELQLMTKNRDLLQAEVNLKNAELALEKAEEPEDKEGNPLAPDPLEVEIKELQVELAEARLSDAEKTLEDAQEALDEAKNASLEIIAPFAGFISKINVSPGHEVKKGTVAVILADPTQFETEVFVSEMDIFKVKLGTRATVQVNAVPTLTLPAKVVWISPTARLQSGVVNYQVKVEIESLQAVHQEQQEARQEISPEELPEQVKKAIEEGRITQEQAEEMMKQRQQGQVPAAILEGFQLREGLTVTVSIIVKEKDNVLLVPNSAITTQGRQTYVQVLSPDGTIEERSIKTGISDWQYTEVTDGLSEGEKVVIPQGTTTTPTTPQQRQPGGPMPIPGMPRIR